MSIDWVSLGTRSFRKFKIFDMKWHGAVSLENVTAAVSPYAGHIAIANNFDDSGASKRQFSLLFFTPSGQLVGKNQWKNSEVMHIGWSCTEDLICVQNDGRAFVYSLFGTEKEIKRFSMGQEAQEMKIIECQMFDSYSGTGVAVLTSGFRFFVINNVDDPKLWRTSEPAALGKSPIRPTCWTVISAERETKIFAVYGSDIYILRRDFTAEQIVPAFSIPVKQYVSISASYDKQFLAFLSENGVVQAASTDMKKAVCECDSGYRGTRPLKFIWCGNEAVAIVQETNFVTLVGLEGDYVEFVFDGAVAVGEEIDGIRIISGQQHEFLGAVPKPTQDIFSVGSMSSSALLFEAFKEYKNKSYKSYDYLRMIEQNLSDAVRQCIEAGANEYDSASQKILLEAASFGKTFCTGVEPDLIVRVSRELRLLNALRDRLIAMPLTYAQFIKLTQPVLIDRLIVRGQWPMAIAACQYLRIPPREGVERVVAHWAVRKIQTPSARTSLTPSVEDDHLLTKQLCEKFAQFPGISYADTAEKAAEFGRIELATRLLENEPNLERQVFMLMKLGRNEKALSRATESGDSDLIYNVILRLRRTMEKKGDLELIIRNFPVAFALYKRYCEAENPQLLKSLHRQTDDFYSQALFCLRDASDPTIFDVKEKIDYLKEAEQCFRNARDDFACSQIADQSKLLTYQAKFEEQFGQTFTDQSLRYTIVWLIEHDENNKAEALRKEFKVTDKQFWYWRIEALAKKGKWQDLETFSKTKKSPIGYMPFVEACVQYENAEEAHKYLTKLNADEKVKGLIKMNLLKEAAEMAFEQKDDFALDSVLRRCGPQHRGLPERIHDLKNQLASSSKRK